VTRAISANGNLGPRGIVEVAYGGRLGNRLAQYSMGRILATKLGFSLQAHPIPGFPHVQSVGPGLPAGRSPHGLMLINTGHRFDLAAVVRSRDDYQRLVLRGHFHRYEYFRPYKHLIREAWLAAPAVRASGPNDLTVHIRSGDIWQSAPAAAVHPEYPALPFSFYAEIVASRAWGKITVVTEDPTDAMVRKVVSTFDAEVRSGGVLDDFNFLRGSSNLTLSVSSYSWWAGWLSRAERIFYPVAGLFDSQQALRRPWHWQQDLWVDDEPRYLAVRPSGSVKPWRGTDEDRARLLST
jgi:hypothetical protein